MNYFELFDIKPAPAIADKTYVSHQYKKLQKQFHPDFFTGSDEAEKEEMLQKSAEVNDAYNTLRDDQKTLAYFLREKNVIEEDEKYNLPPDFLMEMMEINENFADNDAAKNTETVDQLEEVLKTGITGILLKDTAELSETDLLKLKEFYYKRKYLLRVLDRM